MLYHIIDLLCDSVNPLLLLADICIIAGAFWLGRVQRGVGLLLSLVGGLALTYGLFFLDRAFSLWPSFGGDYSTHTTFALAVALPIWLWGRYRRALITLLLIYGVLMVVQRYHSALDIITSAAVFMALALPVLAATRFGKSWSLSKQDG